MTRAPGLGVCLSVPSRQAGRALDRLGKAGLLDRRRGVEQRGQRVLLPLEPAVAGMGPAVPGKLLSSLEAELVEAALPPNPRLPPIEHVRWRLEDHVPGRVLEALPSGWQVLGDVLVLRLADAVAGYEQEIARAFGQVLDVASVLELTESQGELREPTTRLLWGSQETETVHREHGLVFHLDPARVMFSPGNHGERHRLVEQITPGEHVVDLFAGIGYFTLPLARAGARVTACEKSPVSAGYLERNVAANELGHLVTVHRGDCREVAPTGTADRVHVGYFPGTQAFLGCALRALKPEGGVLHYHTLAGGTDPLAEARQELLSNLHLPKRAPQARILDAQRVKSYAPGVVHVVVDAEVVPA